LELMLLVRVREDVGALECLGEEAEDIVDDQNALGGGRGSSRV
jgi:hypothetical protein